MPCGSQSRLERHRLLHQLARDGSVSAAQVSYVDLGGLFHTTRRQLELHDDFAAAGYLRSAGHGFRSRHPQRQARFGADRLDTVESIRIYDGIAATARRIDVHLRGGHDLDELTLEPVIFRDGQFVTCQPMSEFEDYALPRRWACCRCTFAAFRTGHAAHHLRRQGCASAFQDQLLGHEPGAGGQGAHAG